MRTTTIVWAVAIAAMGLVREAAHGHGIPMVVNADGTQLKSEGLVFYDHHESALNPFPAASPTILRGTAGFYPLFGGGIPAGTVLSFDMAGSDLHPAALLFWDGANVLPSPNLINISRTGVSVDVLPTDTFKTGGALGAYNGQLGGHSSANIALPLDAPVGLYAIGFQVTAAGFDRSDTFWGVANNGVPEEDVAAGLAAIRSAVPEPSSWLLLAAGLLGLLAVGGGRPARRLRRRRPAGGTPAPQFHGRKTNIHATFDGTGHDAHLVGRFNAPCTPVTADQPLRNACPEAIPCKAAFRSRGCQGASVVRILAQQPVLALDRRCRLLSTHSRPGALGRARRRSGKLALMKRIAR